MAVCKVSAMTRLGNQASYNSAGHLIECSVEQPSYEHMSGSMYAIGHSGQLEIGYRFLTSCIDVHDFEDLLLTDKEADKMVRLINDNPELKEMYEKYKTMDTLAGNR